MPLSLTTHDIFDVFSFVSNKAKFQVIEMEQTIATAVNKEPFSLRKMFLKCLPSFQQQDTTKGAMGGSRPSQGNLTNNSPISAVRLQITVNDVKGCRKITLKGLYGDAELLKNFIAAFRVKLHELVKQEKQAGGKAKRPMPGV